MHPDTTQGGGGTLNREIRKKTRLSALWQLVGVSLKQKLLIKSLHVLKSFRLRGLDKGLINFHVSNFGLSLKNEMSCSF